MQIHELTPSIEDVYMDPDFIVMIESHLTYLRDPNMLRVLTVSKQQSYKYEGDLFGLLSELGVHPRLHFIVARVNGYVSSADFKGTSEYLLMPDADEITMLKNIYMTRKK